MRQGEHRIGRRTRGSKHVGLAAAAALAAACSATAYGANVTYTIPDSATGNFSALGLTPGVGDLLTDPATQSPGPFSLALDQNVTVGTLNLNAGGAHSGTFTSDGTHVLTLDNTGGTAPNIFGNTLASIGQGANAGTLTVNVAGIVIANTDLAIGSAQGGNVSVGSAITATGLRTLDLIANGNGSGGSDAITGSIGATGSGIAIANLGTGTGTFLLSGVLGPNVTTLTQSSATSQLILGNTATVRGLLNVAAGTLDLQNGGAITSVGSLTGAGNITTAGGGGTVRTLVVGTDATSITFAGAMAEGTSTRPLAFTKTGAGTLTLTGSNAYGGLTTLAGGNLLLNFAAAGAPASGIIGPGLNGSSGLVAAGGSLTIQGAAAATNAEAFGALTVSSGASQIRLLSGASGTTTLSLTTVSRSGGAVVAFGLPTSGTVSLAGGTAGALLAGNGNAPYAYVADANGNLVDFAGKDASNATVVAGATGLPALYSSPTTAGNVNEAGGTYATPVMDLVSNGTTTGIRLSNSTAFVVTNGIRFNSNRGGDWTIDTASSGRILSTGGLLVTTNVGPYNVNVSGAGAIRQPTGGSASDLVLTADNPAGYLNVSSIITTGSSSTATNLVKNGKGTLVLGAANTYTGQTYLDAGVALITTDQNLGALATAATTNLNGGALVGNATFSLDNAGANLRPLALGAAGGTLAATTGNTMTVTGVVGGGGTGAVPAGPLTIGLGALPGSGAGTANGTQLTGDGVVSLTAGNTFNGGVVLNAGTLQINGEFAVGGSVYGGMRFNGGTLRFANVTGTNGSTDVSADSTGTPRPVTFTGAATVDTNGLDVTFANTVGNGGVGSLTKAGGGTLTLAATDNYAGGTAINAGTVRANGVATALGTGTTTVNAGGTLGGSGATGGPVVVNAGGTITAGATAAATGTLTTGPQTWNATGAYLAKVSSDGTTNDALVMSGLTVAATAGAPFAVTVTSAGTPTIAAPVVLAIDADGTAGTNPFSPANAPATLAALTLAVTGAQSATGSFALATQQDAASGYDLILVAAPEPTSLLLAAAAAAPLALGRRRRRT